MTSFFFVFFLFFTLQITLVNFTPSVDGVTQQLLAELVDHERNDLETQKKNLNIQLAALRKQVGGGVKRRKFR